MENIGNRNFLKPYYDFSTNSFIRIVNFILASFKIWLFLEADDVELIICCSLCLCIFPIVIVHGFLCILLLVIVFLLYCLFCIFGLLMATVFSLIGIWPAFIVTFGITSISFYRIPFNIYYTLKVLYYSVCITRTVKCVMLLLFIPVIVVTPLLIFICIFFASVFGSFCVSFIGLFLKPWTKFPEVMHKFWQVYVTDTRAFAHDYGHPTGIPNNWNGTILGGHFNPISIAVAVILLIYGLIAMSLGITLMIFIKFKPLYIFVLHKTAQSYGLNDCIKIYFNTIFSWIKIMRPSRYPVFFKLYISIMPLSKLSDSSIEVIFWFWWASLIGTVIWIVFIPVIIVGPFLTLIMGFVLVVTILPLIYLLIWLFSIIFPIVACGVIILIGPVFSVRCPFAALRHNIMLPGQLERSLRFGFYEVIYFLKYIDLRTSTICNCSLFSHENIPDYEGIQSLSVPPISLWKEDADKVTKIKYWELVYQTLTNVKNELISRGWLSNEEIESAMPNVLIAIPAVSIIEVLVSSISHDVNNKSLIYWDDDNQCDDRSRDRTDTIITVFWPQLLEIRKSLELLLELNKVNDHFTVDHISQEIFYIKAKLCSGDEIQTDVLCDALTNHDFNDEQLVILNRICAKVTNTVLSLLRVDEMNNQLNKIMMHDFRKMPLLLYN